MARTIVGTNRADQPKIQFEDEGVAVGTQGGVTTVDFTGAGVTVTEAGGVLTVNIGGGTVVGGSSQPIVLFPDVPDEPQIIPGPTGPQGPAGANGVIGRDGVTVFLMPDDPELPMMIPGAVGPQGAAGSNGSPGAQGVPGIAVFVTDGEDGQDGLPGPQGPQGPAGTTGSSGIQGLPGISVLVVDGEDGQDGMPIPGPAGQNGAAGAVASPFTGNRAPGSFTITTAQFGIHGKRLELTTTQRGTIQGAGRLSIIN